MIDIDLDNLNEEDVYNAFGVDGNEGEALNDIYLELYELIGRDGMLKLFKYFRGDKELVERLTAKGVEFVSKKEAIDTTTPTGKFMLTIFGAVAELEREYILQRQREGIAIAKDQGKYTGRKPTPAPDFDRVVGQWHRGEITAVEAMRTLKMSKTTFYRRVKQDCQ